MRPVIALLLAFAIGCAPYRFVAETPHPSQERILQLAEVTGASSDHVRALTIRVYPAFVLAGNAVRITCLLPQNTEARSIGYGLADVQTSARLVDRTSYESLVPSVPCGDWVAYCALATGSRVIAHAEHPLISKGTCNEGM